jgi:hypothetical protein
MISAEYFRSSRIAISSATRLNLLSSSPAPILLGPFRELPQIVHHFNPTAFSSARLKAYQAG